MVIIIVGGKIQSSFISTLRCCGFIVLKDMVSFPFTQRHYSGPMEA
jgi:hypothetical protein